MQPLSGIKVLEFTHMVMGPTTGLILADLGAEVTKVEPLNGDNTRRLKGSGAGYFSMYNRNKCSLCLDLKSEQGYTIIKNLISDVDIVIENFRPGAMKKLKLDYTTLKEINSRLIYCSLKGFLSGPYENRTALDEVTQMMGGLAYMTGMPNQPMRAGSSVIDITGGMFGVIAILAALEERHSSGVGTQVTSSLFETTAFIVGQHMAQQAVSGIEPPPMSVRQSAWSIYDIFHSKDNERIFVGVVSDTLWKQFCNEFKLHELLNDESLKTNSQRIKHRDSILSTVRQLFSTMTKKNLCERLDRAGIPFAPINKPCDLFDDPHLNAKGGLLDVTLDNGEKTQLPNLPIEIAGKRSELHKDVPKCGNESITILKNAGYSTDEIKNLIDLNIIQAS